MLVLARQLPVEVVDERRVTPPLPLLLARRDDLVRARARVRVRVRVLLLLSSAAMIWAEGSTWWLGGVGCGGAAAWRCCGPAARRRCGGAAGCLILAHDEELDQSDLASAHAAACLVDDVCKEVVLGREREANELAVVAARLALHRLAKVLVVQLAVLGRRPARGREMAGVRRAGAKRAPGAEIVYGGGRDALLVAARTDGAATWCASRGRRSASGRSCPTPPSPLSPPLRRVLQCAA